MLYIYTYRQWILKHYPHLINFETEFEVIDKAINRYSTNYFAWHHRIWLLKYMNKEEVFLFYFIYYFFYLEKNIYFIIYIYNKL